MGILGRIISLVTSGPAIQNLDRVDMKVDRRDGGVLLPVVVSQHLDGSPETAALIRTKLETYLRFIERGEVKDARYIRVQLNCVRKPDPAATALLESFKEAFLARGAQLSWKW